MTCIRDESGARDGVPRRRLAAGTTSGLLDRPWQRLSTANGSGTSTCVVCSWLDILGFAYFPTSSGWCQGATEASQCLVVHDTLITCSTSIDSYH